MHQLRALLQGTAVRRGLAILTLGAVVALAPLAAMADDNAGGTQVDPPGGIVHPVPDGQFGGALGNGSARPVSAQDGDNSCDRGSPSPLCWPRAHRVPARQSGDRVNVKPLEG